MADAPQIRKIIAATDLSDCASTAVAFSIEIARATGGDVTVVHVESPRPDYTARVLADENTYRESSHEKHVRAEEDLNRHLATFPGVGRIVATGPTASEILGAADLLDADLIVIGTRGQGPVKRALLGSVAEAVILDSRRPVLSVRCEDPPSVPRIRRIVCAVDYSAVSGEAFAMASAFAKAFKAALQVVYVADGEVTPQEKDRLRAWVHTDAIDSKVIATHGTPAATLIDFAKSNEADLLVIGARRTILSKRTALGSTATALTHKAECPVLIVSGERMPEMPS